MVSSVAIATAQGFRDDCHGTMATNVLMEDPLRVFIGIILGIALTVATAFICDALRPSAGQGETAARPMVNWDVVQDNLRGVSERVQEGWARLVNHRSPV